MDKNRGERTLCRQVQDGTSRRQGEADPAQEDGNDRTQSGRRPVRGFLAGADGDVRFQANLSLRDASLDSAPPFLRAFRAHLKALGFDNAIDLGLEAQGDLASFQVSRLQAASGSHRLDLSGSVQTLGMLLDLTGTCDKQVEVQIAGSLVDPDWKVAPPRQPAAPK